ncbi:MAG: T9SS type A sorting domain-containing protein [Ignavibacteriales bacterium]|nr:T9SS type A sorting domain-containing protein [Ignavibacteriales bacterium]
MKSIISIILLFLFAQTSNFAQIVVNGDFEYGNSGWTIYSKSGQGLIGTASFFASSAITPPVYPKSGEYMARLGGFGYDESEISQNIILPNTNPLYLSIFYQSRSFTGAECSGLYHGGEVKIVIAGQMMYNGYLCYYNDMHQWTNVYFDVSAAAGQTIQVILRVDAANSMWSYLYLDDLEIRTLLPVDDEKRKDHFQNELLQNVPNPFNPTTSIQFSLSESDRVSIKIYDILGNLISEIINEYRNAGNHKVDFNAINLPGGIYFCNLSTKKISLTRKMCLIK